MPIQITIQFQGRERLRLFPGERVTLGRPSESDAPDLDLSADSCVSRHHAVVFVEDGACWLQDLGSRFGTQVNGIEVRPPNQHKINPEDLVQLGETTLRVQLVSDTDAPSASAGTETQAVPGMRILQMIDTSRPIALEPSEAASAAERRLALLLDLPRQFGAETRLNDLLQTVMNRVVKVIPSAKRGALLLRDPKQDALLLKAYVSSDEPAVSETLARRAINEKRGFIWRSNQSGDTSRSLLRFEIVTGMYAPLQWQDQVFGVICVDTPVITDSFKEDDLKFLIALGQFAAMALAEQQYQAELKQNSKLVQRLMANFSPKVREHLLEQARLGRLRPGGSKSEVTVLFCDICGFTKRAAEMDSQDVVDMVNHYFQPLADTIFRNDGTVDKFLGDGVLAVFGSPDADPHHHQKAVRAAWALQQAAQATSQLREARGDITCPIRVGVHCGEVFHGFVGPMDRLEFTVIGDAVNRANRYCEGAGDGEIMISPDVFQRVFNLVRADKTNIQTKEGTLVAYRLKGLKD